MLLVLTFICLHLHQSLSSAIFHFNLRPLYCSKFEIRILFFRHAFAWSVSICVHFILQQKLFSTNRHSLSLYLSRLPCNSSFACHFASFNFVYTKFVDKIFLPNRYNVSLDKSFACIIHHSRDCETEELIFSLAFEQIEICVPYLSWV